MLKKSFQEDNNRFQEDNQKLNDGLDMQLLTFFHECGLYGYLNFRFEISK